MPPPKIPYESEHAGAAALSRPREKRIISPFHSTCHSLCPRRYTTNTTKEFYCLYTASSFDILPGLVNISTQVRSSDRDTDERPERSSKLPFSSKRRHCCDRRFIESFRTLVSIQPSVQRMSKPQRVPMPRFIERKTCSSCPVFS